MLSDTDAVADERSRQAELEDLENVAQKAIKKELKTVLTRYLQTVKPSKNLSKDDFIPDYTLTKTSKEAVLSTERLIGASFLLGMEHAERDRKEKEINATDTEIPPIAFTEAINFLKSKVPLTKDDWLELEPKLRFRAFTVAKLAECDFISTAHTQLLGAFEDGTGYTDFWNRIKATVNDNVFDIRPGYWENVYRTNTQSAYIAGKLQQFEKTQPVAYRLLVIEDSRTSEICKHLVRESGYGVVLPSSHNFWKKYGFPPYHFQCRTGIQGVYKSQIGKDKDLMPENVPMKDFNKFHVQEGFGGNPLENGNWWKMSESQIKRGIEYGIINMFNRDENVFADYDSVWKNYTRYEGKNGGWYDLTETVPNDWESNNKKVVEFLADKGYKIKVLPEFNMQKKAVWKNPDILLNGITTDIKEPTSMTDKAIRGRIASSYDQKSKQVVLNIPDEMPVEEIESGFELWRNLHHSRKMDFLMIYKGIITTGVI